MVRKLSEAVQNHDGNNVDPSIIQACLAEYTTVDTELKRLSQRQAAMLSRYEKQGVNVKSIKSAHRASKLDKSVAKAQARSDMRYLIISGVLNPATDTWAKQVSQSDLFSEDEEIESVGVASPELARARAHADGYNSGKHGGDATANPHLVGTAEYVAWQAGCTDGNQDRKLKPGAAGVKLANTERRGRGRPPGSRNKRNGEDHDVNGHA